MGSNIRGVADYKEFALKKAIKDLDSQIKILQKDKITLKKTLEKVSENIEKDRKLEANFQTKLDHIIGKETKLNEKKKAIQYKLANISEKISKISNIKSEMTNI